MTGNTTTTSNAHPALCGELRSTSQGEAHCQQLQGHPADTAHRARFQDPDGQWWQAVWAGSFTQLEPAPEPAGE